VIDRAGDARRLRAVRATEERPPGFDAVADDVAPAVIADRRELVDGTLKAVEHMSLTGRDYLEREMVVVSADFTLSHERSSFVSVRIRLRSGSLLGRAPVPLMPYKRASRAPASGLQCARQRLIWEVSQC
jgi:hypothetical protein